jgi:ribose transport system substrate-binding protein
MKSHGESGASARDSVSGRYAVRSVLRAVDILRSFSSIEETLELRSIAQRSRQNKSTAFRLAETLVETGLLGRVGHHGYRLCVDLSQSKRFRIGYAAQSSVVAFTATVTDALAVAASLMNIDFIVLNNRFSPKIALKNAEVFVREGVDLVIDSQIDIMIASQLAARFSDAQIPFIAVDIPHPSAYYFGADNYKAGRMAGRYLGQWSAKQWKDAPTEIYFIAADAAGAHLNARLRGMYDGLVEIAPQLRRIQPSHLNTKGQFEITLDTMRKTLRRRKLRRVLVGCVNDVSALGALQAFRDYGMEEECGIMGQDGCSEAREELRKGATRFVCTTAFYPERYGAGLIEFAMNILNKKAVPLAIFTQHELLTKENVGRIYPNDDWMANAALR